MERFCYIKPTDFYNLIQQKSIYPSLSDNNFLLILDARDSDDYAESHIITAKLAPRMETEYSDPLDHLDGQWKVPYYAELECKQHIVVYDGKTSSSVSDEGESKSPAISLARFLVAHGSKNSVLIVNGGYENFSALYPFLRTKKILYMPKKRWPLEVEGEASSSLCMAPLSLLSSSGPIQDWRRHEFYRNSLELDVVITYPTEIIQSQVYMANIDQALDKRIQKDLKIGAHIAVTKDNRTYFPTDDSSRLLRIPIEDDISEDLLAHLETACKFIDQVNEERGKPVLIYSNLGISRNAAVAMAFLVHKSKCTLKEAWDHVIECQTTTRPNRGFVKQLSQWEESVLGELKTSIDDPAF